MAVNEKLTTFKKLSMKSWQIFNAWSMKMLHLMAVIEADNHRRVDEKLQ